MSHRLTIEYETIEDLKLRLAEMMLALGEGAFERPKLAGSGKKAPVKKAEAPVYDQAAVDEATALTYDAAEAILKQVNDVKGLVTAKKILNDLGYNRMSDVKPEHYGGLVDACKKFLEQ